MNFNLIKKKGIKANGLSESQLSYLLIIPTLIGIIALAIIPICRTFWLSMFDLKLNNPTKSEIYISYKLNVERYADTYFSITGNISGLIDSTDGEVKLKLEKVGKGIEEIHTVFIGQEKIKLKYEKVDAILAGYQSVTDQNLKYADIKRDMADNIDAKVNNINKIIASIGEIPEKNEELRTLRQLSEEIRNSVIRPNFIGFANYGYYLKDERIAKAMWNTMVFTFVSVFFEFVVGLGIALLINKRFRGKEMVRATVLIPWAIPTAIGAMMWKFLYDGQNGIVAFIFSKIGLISDPGVLMTSKFWAMFATIFADVWKTSPWMALLLYAGLQQIPDEMYEASEVDGANKIQQFFHITLPLLKNIILVSVVFRSLDAFRVFDLIYVLTGGGPANSTETIAIYAYKTMFSQMEFGKGSALSFIVFGCIMLLSIIYIKLLEDKEK